MGFNVFFWREMTIENLANNILNKLKKNNNKKTNSKYFNLRLNFFSIEEISFYLKSYLNSFSCITSSQT